MKTTRQELAEAAELPTPDSFTSEEIQEFFDSNIWKAVQLYFVRAHSSALDELLSKEFNPAQASFYRGFIRGLEVLFSVNEDFRSDLEQASMVREKMLEHGRVDELADPVQALLQIRDAINRIKGIRE